MYFKCLSHYKIRFPAHKLICFDAYTEGYDLAYGDYQSPGRVEQYPYLQCPNEGIIQIVAANLDLANKTFCPVLNQFSNKFNDNDGDFFSRELSRPKNKNNL